MTLHISTIRPPSPEQVRYARAVDAALAEAGYPDACVGVTDLMCGVSVSTWPTRTGPPAEVIERAYAVVAPLRPGRG